MGQILAYELESVANEIWMSPVTGISRSWSFNK